MGGQDWTEVCTDDSYHAMMSMIEPVQEHPYLFGGMALGALALLVVVVRQAWKWAPVGFAALYTRLSKGDVAKHPARAQLLEAIRGQPGVSTADLAMATRLAQGTLLYHLRTLERGAFVKSLLVGRDRLWFEAGTKLPAPEEMSLLDPSRRAILQQATSAPGLTQTDLARRLSMSLPNVHHHVRELESQGIVRIARDGAATRVFPSGGAPRFSLRPHE